MGYLLEAAAILLSIGLILFIVNSAINLKNYKQKAIINFLICLFLVIIFVGSYFLDYYVFKKVYDKYIYYMFIASSVLYLIILPLVMLKKAGKYTRGFRKNEFYRAEEKITDYVYIIYKYQETVYLKDSKGIISKISKHDYEKKVIENINNYYHLTINNVEIHKYGVVTISTNKKKNKYDRYSCYLININKPLKDTKFKQVFKNDVVKEELEYLDKQIIYRLLIEEDFRIYL